MKNLSLSTNLILSVFVGTLSLSAIGCGGPDLSEELNNTSDQLKVVTVKTKTSGVEQVSPSKFIVSSKLVEKYASNPSALGVKNVWQHQERATKKKYGVRIGKVPMDSVLFELGLRSYDVLVSVNGYEISSAAEVTKAFWNLQSEKYLVIDVERMGRKGVLEYIIR